MLTAHRAADYDDVDDIRLFQMDTIEFDSYVARQQRRNDESDSETASQQSDDDATSEHGSEEDEDDAAVTAVRKKAAVLSLGGTRDGTTEAMLPDDTLAHVFSFLDADALSASSLVCRRWLVVSKRPYLWKRLCALTWPTVDWGALSSDTDLRMEFFTRPRVRLDGLYICKQSYWRSGMTEGRKYMPTFEVVYFRYLRFFPDGSCIYYMTPDKPVSVIKWFKWHDARVWRGTYGVDDTAVSVEATQPMPPKPKASGRRGPRQMHEERTPSVQRFLFQLASTRRGANNRLLLYNHLSVEDNRRWRDDQATETTHFDAGDETRKPDKWYFFRLG